MFLEPTLFYGLNLIIGPVLVLWAWKLASRHPYAFLQPFKIYQLAWVVYGFLFYLGEYALRQVPGIDSQNRFMLFQVFAVLPVPVWSFFVYMFLVWSSELVQRQRPAWLPLVFWSIQLVLIGVNIYNVAVVFPKEKFDLGLLIGRVLDWIYLGHLVLVPLILLGWSRQVDDPSRKRLAQCLGLVYLMVNLVPAVAILSTWAFESGVNNFLFVQSLVFLGICIPPLGLIHWFLNKYPLRRPITSGLASAEDVFQQFDLNKREREIVPLITKGLTNDEIASELFISVKTVKNNISSIYRKTGLRNRVELTNLLRLK